MVNVNLRKNTERGFRPFLSRLGSDKGGNVLALAAACIPPILVLVGSGIDMSRAYMTQASLQSACDAGVLAGRRAQAKSGYWNTAEQAKAQRMFNFNYQATAASATSTTFTPTNAGNGVISGTASTTIPTVVMKMFGTNTFTLTANCSAEFQISNIDVMLVLDTTGSMACRPDGSNCNSDSSSKIYGLKEAVRQFYYTIAAAVPGGGTTRVRFGFVPYSGTVNMGGLVAAGDIPSSYFTASTTYQTKVANFTTAVWTGTELSSTTVPETYGSSISRSNCTAWSRNDYPSSGSNPVQTGSPPSSNVTSITYGENSWTRTSGSNGTCVRNKTTAVISGPTAVPKYQFTDWSYDDLAVDTSSIRTLASVPIATAVDPLALVPTSGSYDMVQLGAMSGTTGITTTNTTWGGCIEERNTVNARFTNASAPSGALDHDLTSAPTNDASRWHPYYEALEFDRGQRNNLNNTSINYAPTTSYCVPPAMKFTTVDTAAPTTVPSWLETYLGTLVARGNTYHDIGMMWGARLANPAGIMASNVNAGGLTSISRHIIMLTDGEMAPNSDVYNAYGLEYIDNRVAPAGQSNNNLADYHNSRFLTACQTAKNMGYTIWFIGFGQTLSTSMTTCATSGHAFYASDTDSLEDTFRHIASQVADLRLKT